MITLIAGIVVGFVAASVCYKLDSPKTPVGGKLIVDTSNPEEVAYQLVIFDQTGEMMKQMDRILVDIEVSKVIEEEVEDETNSD